MDCVRIGYATARQRLAMWPAAGMTSGDRVGVIEAGEQVHVVNRANVVREGVVTEWIRVRRGERVGWVRAAMVREGE